MLQGQLRQIVLCQDKSVCKGTSALNLLWLGQLRYPGSRFFSLRQVLLILIKFYLYIVSPSFLFLVVRPLFLVAMPGAPSSFLF